MTNFYSDQFAPRGSATQVVHAGLLPNRRFKVLPGISRVPIHATRGYFDFQSPDNPFIQASDELRFMSVKSSDRIYELNIWVTDRDYGDWAGVLSILIGLYEQGQNHDGPVVDGGFFATTIDIVGDAPLQREDEMMRGASVNVISEAQRGWQLWEMMNLTLPAFNDVHDPHTEYDIVGGVALGPPTGTQGAILLEMIFSPAGV